MYITNNYGLKVNIEWLTLNILLRSSMSKHSSSSQVSKIVFDNCLLLTELENPKKFTAFWIHKLEQLHWSGSTLTQPILINLILIGWNSVSPNFARCNAMIAISTNFMLLGVEEFNFIIPDEKNNFYMIHYLHNLLWHQFWIRSLLNWYNVHFYPYLILLLGI